MIFCCFSASSFAPSYPFAVADIRRQPLETGVDDERQVSRIGLWLDQGDGVGIGILEHANVHRRRIDPHVGCKNPQVMAVTGAKQHAVLSQRDGLGVLVMCGVGDVKENGHAAAPVG